MPQYTLFLPFLLQRKVVTLVKENKKATTLSIGDGANDVGMIKGVRGGGGSGRARTVWLPVLCGGGGGSGGQGLCGHQCRGGEWGARTVWLPVPCTSEHSE